MTLPESPTTPSPSRHRAAVYANQRAWVRRAGSVDVSGDARAVYESGELVAARTGPTGAIMLPDPPETAIVSLPGAIAWLRQSGSTDVLVWSATPNRQLDRWLGANGARDSFTPLWMRRSLERTPRSVTSGVATVRPGHPDDLPRLLASSEIPYHSPWQAHATHRLATAPETSGEVELMIALVEGEVVGRAVMSISGHTAGIYDVGVAPRWQRHGIGRQLMDVLLETARQREIEEATLNATPDGERLYRALGFEDAGQGQTWLLPTETLRRPPDADMVRFAMLISGGGEPELMGYLARWHLPNGDTPLAHAARFGQVDVGRQLVLLGTIPDIAALWELGLEGEAREAMRDREALNARRGPQQATPLHIAIYWDDPDLMDALLDAGADPYIRDGTFDSDARGWCHALGRDEALELLNERFPVT